MIRRVIPYLLVVLAAWAGSYFWYEQNEDRRQATIDRLTTEQFSEDVDSCKRVNYGARRPINHFFSDVTDIRGLRRSEDPAARALWRHAKEARKDTRPQDCLRVVGAPDAGSVYEPDPGERNGIPLDAR